MALIPNPQTLENLINDASDVNAFNDGVKAQAVSPRVQGVEEVIVQVADDPFLTPTSSGTASATTANKLVDAAATFITDGVQVGDSVFNTTDNTVARVTALDSETTLSIDADIMANLETYAIREASYWAQKFAGGEWKRSATPPDGNNALLTYALPVTAVAVDVHYIVYPWLIADIANYPAK